MDLTVAICIYNGEKYIGETLKCISRQTRQDFNLMIVNDCSSDQSTQIIREYFKTFPRQFEIVDFQENQGLCAGRRYVEENAKTKYILFIDADDCPLPNLVEDLYNKISSDDNLMAVGCHLSYMDSDGKNIPGGIFLGAKTKEEFFKKARNGKLIFMQPTAIYDREIALSVGGHNMTGFPEGKPRYRDLCEDLDLWCRMSDLYIEGKAIIVVPKILCRYRKHPSAMSSNSIGMILRMKHIKNNVKRRRAGKTNLSFIDFYDSLSSQELKKLKKDAEVADNLRNGVFLLKSGNLIKGTALIGKSICQNPAYFLDKLKHNFFK